MSNVFIIFLDFFLYAVAMFLLGFYAMTKAKGNEEFILGGRSIGPYTSAISAGASDMSSWLILGLPGAVFAGGLVEGLWISLGLIIGAYLNWHLVAAKLREYSEKLNALTIPSFLQNRFNSKGTAIKTIATIVILVFFTLYVASALKAGSPRPSGSAANGTPTRHRHRKTRPSPFPAPLPRQSGAHALRG